MTGDRLYPTRPILAASVAVFRDGRVLLAARGKPPWEGVFSLPGGVVEIGETLGEAALRELEEEVGVKAKLIGLVAPVEVIEREADGRVKHHLVIAAHAARWVSGEPQTGPEAKDICWVTERDIVGLPMTPGLAGILEQAFRLAAQDPAA
ncbi:NUDIX hydrolase [Microvirga subterranea]|uniref:ADP-ribose pyrophosphatase YjhB (NUDIX family) n=1 Tax=Microvirga subterranea TaxID=186651 RepID=A0A370HCW0_9HYPH|nr:NUDIX domain-containing protein [Microvirga subterranea]RDI55068.1 ADP-ribose pyrophosphatase YjhB (NUDIX family) [Microvirga subterranea]